MTTEHPIPGPLRDFVGYGRRTPRVYWPNGAAVALNFAINQEEGSEYSKGDGDKRHETMAEIPYAMPAEYRDLDVESVFEYGSRAGIWRLLRLFDEYGIKITILACALAVERNPETGNWFRETGHEPCSHGWRWEEPWLLSRDEEREHIRLAVESLEKTCGERPVGWFCRYGPSINTRELLAEEGGFLYDSDAFNDDLPFFTEVNGKRHLVLPYTHVYNDGRYVLAPGYWAGPVKLNETVGRRI
jgi:peptidoglycan/xylan/chitin deacetylase (PgdA/CDA1 family)